MDILQKIFDGKYDITPIADKKQQELDDKCCAEWDRVVQVLGLEFADRLIDLEGEQADRLSFHYYRAGFQLGVLLMLEALGLSPLISAGMRLGEGSGAAAVPPLPVLLTVTWCTGSPGC